MSQGYLESNSRLAGVKLLTHIKGAEFDVFSGFLKQNSLYDFLTLQVEYDKSTKVSFLLPYHSSFWKKKQNLGQIWT